VFKVLSFAWWTSTTLLCTLTNSSTCTCSDGLVGIFSCCSIVTNCVTLNDLSCMSCCLMTAPSPSNLIKICNVTTQNIVLAGSISNVLSSDPAYCTDRWQNHMTFQFKTTILLLRVQNYNVHIKINVVLMHCKKAYNGVEV